MNAKRFIKKIVKLKPFNIILLSFASILKPLFFRKHVKFLSKIPVNHNITVRMPKSTFAMYNNGNDTIANKLYWLGSESYEPQTSRLLINLLKPNDVFFDVGANTGIYSLMAASLSRNLFVHAFEPFEEAFKFLKRSKEINNFNNLFINQMAISSSEGKSILKIEREKGNSIPLGSSLAQVVEKQEIHQEIEVATMKLDSYIAKENLSKVDLIKIDTEGTEHEVLKGAERLLYNFIPLLICEVLHNLIEEKLHQILDSQNYNYYLISNKGPFSIKKCDRIVGDKYIVSNYLFIPKEKDKFDL